MIKKDAPKRNEKKRNPHLPPPETAPGILNKLVNWSAKVIKKFFND